MVPHAGYTRVAADYTGAQFEVLYDRAGGPFFRAVPWAAPTFFTIQWVARVLRDVLDFAD